MTRAATEAGVRLTEAQWQRLRDVQRSGSLYVNYRQAQALEAHGLVRVFGVRMSRSGVIRAYAFGAAITPAGRAALEQHSRDTQRTSRKDKTQ